nr:MAG TPA: hypothetical protein [Caudoviricetes sp.]
MQKQKEILRISEDMYILKLFQIVHMRERKMLIYLISQQGMK